MHETYKILQNHDRERMGDYEMIPNAQLTIMSTDNLFIGNEEAACDEALRNPKDQLKPN